MQIDTSKLASSSLLAGLQNIGSYSGTATISGTIPANGYMTSSFTLNLPNPKVVTLIRLAAPDQSSNISPYWYPLMGNLTLYETNYIITVYATSDPAGRRLKFSFINRTASAIILSGMRYNLVAHTYAFPW